MPGGEDFIADLYFPGRDQPGVLLVHLNAQAVIALYTVVGFDIANRLMHMAHHLGKVDLRLAGSHSEPVCGANLMGGAGGTN